MKMQKITLVVLFMMVSPSVQAWSWPDLKGTFYYSLGTGVSYEPHVGPIPHVSAFLSLDDTYKIRHRSTPPLIVDGKIGYSAPSSPSGWHRNGSLGWGKYARRVFYNRTAAPNNSGYLNGSYFEAHSYHLLAGASKKFFQKHHVNFQMGVARVFNTLALKLESRSKIFGFASVRNRPVAEISYGLHHFQNNDLLISYRYIHGGSVTSSKEGTTTPKRANNTPAIHALIVQLRFLY